MSYSDPEPAARVAYAAVRQLRAEQGCLKGPVWDLLLREEQEWYILHAGRAMMGLMAREIQDAWREDLTVGRPPERRWRHGPQIDHSLRTHPELAHWNVLDDRFRRRFFVIQMNAVGMNVTITALLGDSPCVTAP
jgi:hypothetical protein